MSDGPVPLPPDPRAAPAGPRTQRTQGATDAYGASTRTRPPRLDAVEAVYQTMLLSLRRSVRGARLVVALVLVLLPLAISIPVAGSADVRHQEEFFYGMISFYHFGIAVPAVALAMATAFPWPEAEEGTLTYWFTAPVSRWAIHLGRFLAAWIVGSVVLPLSVAAIAVPLDTAPAASVSDVAVTAVTATLLAYPAYLAVFWLAATWIRKGIVVGVVFILLENFLSMIPANVVRLTLIHYVRSIVWASVPETSKKNDIAEVLGAVEPVTTVAAATTCVLTAVTSLVLSLLLVEWIEYRGKTSQAG